MFNNRDDCDDALLRNISKNTNIVYSMFKKSDP